MYTKLCFRCRQLTITKTNRVLCLWRPFCASFRPSFRHSARRSPYLENGLQDRNDFWVVATCSPEDDARPFIFQLRSRSRSLLPKLWILYSNGFLKNRKRYLKNVWWKTCIILGDITWMVKQILRFNFIGCNCAFSMKCFYDTFSPP